MKLTREKLYRMIREEIESDLPWDLRPQPLNKDDKPWPTSQEKETEVDEEAPDPASDPAFAKILLMIEQLSSRLSFLEDKLEVKAKGSDTWGETQE